MAYRNPPICSDNSMLTVIAIWRICIGSSCIKVFT